MTYSYNPTKIKDGGKDQMRFELSDTFVEIGADGCALSDEEYDAMLEGLDKSERAWKTAKLKILEAIMFKMSYQVNTKVDMLAYDFSTRAEIWRKLYETLKKQLSGLSAVPTMSKSIIKKPSYFYTGMHENMRG